MIQAGTPSICCIPGAYVAGMTQHVISGLLTCALVLAVGSVTGQIEGGGDR